MGGKSRTIGIFDQVVFPKDWGPCTLELEGAGKNMARIRVTREDGKEPFFLPFRHGFKLTLTKP